MENIRIDQTVARRMLGMDAAGHGAAGWGDDELEVAWVHLLRLEWGSVVRTSPARETDASAATPIGDLLHAPDPQPVGALRALKEWAQEVMRGNGRRADEVGPIPPQAASALYHLVIVLALVWHGAAISGMDMETLVEGVRWVSRQKWVDPHSQAILARWLVTVGG